MWPGWLHKSRISFCANTSKERNFFLGGGLNFLSPLAVTRGHQGRAMDQRSPAVLPKEFCIGKSTSSYSIPGWKISNSLEQKSVDASHPKGWCLQLGGRTPGCLFQRMEVLWEQEHSTWSLSPGDGGAGGAGGWHPGAFPQGTGVLGLQEPGACSCRIAATERGSRPGNKLSEPLGVSGTSRAAPWL